MLKINLFLKEFLKRQSWVTIGITLLVFYAIGIIALRFATIVSLLEQFPLSESAKLVALVFVRPLDAFTLGNFVLFLVSGFLFGSQIVALRLYVKKRFFNSHHSLGFVGMLGTLFGCLACCGSIIVVTFIGALGVSLGTLPFNGQEIAFVGIAVSLLALLYTVKKIDDPLVC